MTGTEDYKASMHQVLDACDGLFVEELPHGIALVRLGDEVTEDGDCLSGSEACTEDSPSTFDRVAKQRRSSLLSVALAIVATSSPELTGISFQTRRLFDGMDYWAFVKSKRRGGKRSGVKYPHPTSTSFARRSNKASGRNR